jgi:hypothetical protein
MQHMPLPFVRHPHLINQFTSSLVDIPLPYTDPICSLAEALGVAGLTVHRPRHAHTVVITTDSMRRGIGLHASAPLTNAGIHHVVAQCSAHAAAAGAVVVSVRNSAPVAAGDTELLHRLELALHHAGIQLIDFVCVGRGGLYCPRTLINGTDPWSGGTTTG